MANLSDKLFSSEATYKTIDEATHTFDGFTFQAGIDGDTGYGTYINSLTARLGQEFISSGETLTAITARLQNNGATADGDLVFEIWDEVGGEPNSVIATSTTTLAANTMGIGYNDHTFNFTPIALSASTKYFVIGKFTSYVTGSISWKGGTAAGADDSAFNSSDSGATWSENTGFGLWLEITRDQSFWSFDASFRVEVPSTNTTDNVINVSNSPIGFNANDCAYIIPDVNAGTGDATVLVNTLPNIPSDAIILAREISGKLLINDSVLLLNGASSKTITEVSASGGGADYSTPLNGDFSGGDLLISKNKGVVTCTLKASSWTGTSVISNPAFVPAEYRPSQEVCVWIGSKNGPNINNFLKLSIHVGGLVEISCYQFDNFNPIASAFLSSSDFGELSITYHV
jgi:hypothetical protein